MRTTEPGQSFLLLLDIVDVLESQKIPYAVVGAMAASFHGAVRASLDADAILSLTAKSLQSLENQLKAIGLQTTFRKGASDDPITAVLSLSDSYDNRVDLLVGIRGFDPEAFSRSISAKIGQAHLQMIGLEDFVAMKLFAGGPQDLMDAQRTLAVSSSSLNRSLLEQLTSRYGKKYLKLLKSIFANDKNKND